MKNIKKFLFIIIALILTSFVSAYHTTAPFDHRYHGDSSRSSASYYNSGSGSSSNYESSYESKYNTDDRATVPIFKGSYGNYKYKMYEMGDQRPSYFFVDYPDYGYPSFFNGGYGNYYGRGFGYGYGGYGGGYGGSFGGYGGYGYRNVGYNYPAYTVPFFWY